MSAVCKVASAVGYNMLCSLAAKLLAETVARLFIGYEGLMSAACHRN